MSDMKVTSREFQRVQPKTWQGALKGRAQITGDLKTTGLEWEAS